MRTLEYLVTGHYRQAAKLVTDTDTDAALVFYLTRPIRCWCCGICWATPPSLPRKSI
jgi:hypothetical protein